MTGAEGFQHNAQVAGEHQLIVATELTTSDQWTGLEVKEMPETVLADVGYSNERDLSVLEARGGYVAPGRESKRMVNRDPHGSADPHTRTRRRMVEKLATPTTREYYAQRKWLRGWEVLGFRRFSVRDPDKARGALVCVWRVKRLQPLPAM